MKSLIVLSLACFLSSPAMAANGCAANNPDCAASEPTLEVQLDNPAYASVVQAYFKSTMTKIKFVSEVSGTDYVKISMAHDFSRGAACRVYVEAAVGGMMLEAPSSKSSSLVSRKAGPQFCQKFLASALKSALSMVF